MVVRARHDLNVSCDERVEVFVNLVLSVILQPNELLEWVPIVWSKNRVLIIFVHLVVNLEVRDVLVFLASRTQLKLVAAVHSLEVDGHVGVRVRVFGVEACITVELASM